MPLHGVVFKLTQSPTGKFRMFPQFLLCLAAQHLHKKARRADLRLVEHFLTGHLSYAAKTRTKTLQANFNRVRFMASVTLVLSVRFRIPQMQDLSEHRQ